MPSATPRRRRGVLACWPTSSSRRFLARFAGRPLDLAVDLGCGAGHTTRLLASVLGPRRALGLDQSASFVALAAADAPPGVEFAVHDVTRAPFPCPPADLLSCRLLLSHLPNPPGLTRRHDRLATLSPPAPRAAAMFAQNLAIWGPQALEDGVAGEREVGGLVEDLELLAAGGRPATITWELRQLAYRRSRLSF